MILPGQSGSTLLLILGLYMRVMSISVISRNYGFRYGDYCRVFLDSKADQNTAPAAQTAEVQKKRETVLTVKEEVRQ